MVNKTSYQSSAFYLEIKTIDNNCSISPCLRDWCFCILNIEVLNFNVFLKKKIKI